MIAIIGAGAAGWSAAEALRALGYTGKVCVFGAEPAAPYERPALSKAFLRDRELQQPPPLATDPSLGVGVGLELNATVVSIDPRSRTIATSAGAQLGYERLLLATGAECRPLRIPGSELAGIHYLRDIRDARELRAELGPGRRIVIIGGGVIGLEVAGSARVRGCEVTVIEVASQLMGRVVPPELASALADLHRARGVTVRTATRPVAFDAAAQRVAGVTLESGEVVAADAVVVGVGVVPRTELAVNAGLAVDDGVLVDDRFTSSDEHILAAGDVARVFHAGEQRHVRMEQWRPAQEQGRQAAASMIGLSKAYRDIPWMWSDQHELHIQASGFGFEDSEIVRRGDLQQRAGLGYLGVRGGRVVAACGVSVGTGIARMVRAAQTLIEHGAQVDVDALRDPGLDLRRLARRVAASRPEEAVGAP
jgi:3-phenylpropionate/trans-cinnamate dioxygenase ferredoxin reductase component